MGKGNKVENKTSSGPGQNQLDLISGQTALSAPVLSQLMSTLMGALSGNGVPERTGTMQRGVEAGRYAASQKVRGVVEGNAAKGVNGSAAEGMKAGANAQADSSVAGIVPQIIQQIMAMIPGMSMLQGSPVFGGAVVSNTNGGGSGGQDDLLQGLAALISAGSAANNAFGSVATPSTTPTSSFDSWWGG